MPDTRQDVKVSRASKHRLNWQGLPASAIALRDEWGITKPALHRMPQWLKPRVRAAIKAGLITNRGFSTTLGGWHALHHASRQLGGSWIDHAGLIRLSDGREILVSEPYGLTDAACRELETFCQTLGLTYEIDALSWWFPTRTLRIVVSEVHCG